MNRFLFIMPKTKRLFSLFLWWFRSGFVCLRFIQAGSDFLIRLLCEFRKHFTAVVSCLKTAVGVFRHWFACSCHIFSPRFIISCGAKRKAIRKAREGELPCARKSHPEPVNQGHQRFAFDVFILDDDKSIHWCLLSVYNSFTSDCLSCLHPEVIMDT